MPQRQEYLTKEGLSKIEAELKRLREVERPEVADRIQRSKELGGTPNNAEYDAAKAEQAIIEGRIIELEAILTNASIIPEDAKSAAGRILIGSHVTVRAGDGKEEQYVIVGRMEASPKDGKISNESPVGKALLGKKMGESVEVKTPSGALKYKVVKVK